MNEKNWSVTVALTIDGALISLGTHTEEAAHQIATQVTREGFVHKSSETRAIHYPTHRILQVSVQDTRLGKVG